MATQLSKNRGSLSAKDLSRTVFVRFILATILFSIALVVAFFGSAYVLSNFTWYGDELLYPILHIISSYPILFLFFCWLIGFFVMLVVFWKKSFGYIDTIVDASNKLVASDDDLIYLPAELKQVEDRMNQIKQVAIRNARLAKESEQRKSDLIVYLAHDLKTPLTSVIGYLTLLHDEQQISEEFRDKYLSISLEKAERLEDLINEFFEITRFNLSELTLEISQVNLTRMLEQITFEFKPMFADKNLQCTLHAAPDIIVKFDVNKMERVFDNLLRNAINYSFENSMIEIDLKHKEDGVYIQVRNQGNTIPKEKLNRIFEQFYRLDASRGTKAGGAGLGLAIAKEIIELHEGRITATSENEIIEFIVYLPILL